MPAAVKERTHALSPRQLEEIVHLAENLRFGAITLVFQDGRLVQIERNEKFRLSQSD